MEALLGEKKQYEILEKIGEGRTGEVYRANCYSLSGLQKDQVAIKFLKKKKNVQELITEYQVIRSLNIEAIIQVYSIEKIDKKTAIIMEWVDGLPLSYILHYSPSEKLSTYLYQKVHLALQQLAEKKIFHGDLAPQNILVTKKGEIKLIDFANHYDKGFLQYGTSKYIPEEIFRGEHYGIESDLNALSLIFPKASLDEKYRYEEISHELSYVFCENEKSTHQTRQILKNKKKSSKSLFLHILVCFYVLIFQFIPSQASNNEGQSYLIHFISKKWLYIEIEGHSGYAPQSFEVKKKNVLVKWKTQSRKGEKFLAIKKLRTRIYLHDLLK